MNNGYEEIIEEAQAIQSRGCSRKYSVIPQICTRAPTFARHYGKYWGLNDEQDRPSSSHCGVYSIVEARQGN